MIQSDEHMFQMGWLKPPTSSPFFLRISDLDWDAEFSQAKLSGTASQVEKAETSDCRQMGMDGFGWMG